MYEGGTPTYGLLSHTYEGASSWDNYEFIGDVLLKAYSITQNTTYLQYAVMQAEWIVSQAIREGPGLKFPYQEGGSLSDSFVTARVYRFLITMYNVTENTLYRDTAEDACAWLEYSAAEENGGYKWLIQGLYRDTYNAGFEGASGVGYNLLSGAASSMLPTQQLAVTLAGEFDYSHNEKTRVKIAAMVTYANAPQLVPGANVMIKIRDPKNNMWVSSNMTEIDDGIFAWESNETVNQIYSRGGDGVYIAYAEVSKEGCLNGSAIRAIHIDPPTNEAADGSGPFLTIITSATALIAIVAIALVYIRKKRSH
jgi:hypothetical protein